MDFARYLVQLEAVYSEHDVPWSTQAGASESALAAAERTLGFALDPALSAAWRSSDGSADEVSLLMRPDFLTGYEFLSLKAALAAREGMRKRAKHYAGYADPEPRDPRIQAGWFHEGWLPFASFGGATLLLIQDYAPAPGGQVGQIIGYVHDPDEIAYVTTDFADLLTRSLRDIQADPEEFLQLF